MEKQPSLRAKVRAHLRRQFGAAAGGEDGYRLVKLCLKAIDKMNSGHGDAVISTTKEDGPLTADQISEAAKLCPTFLTKH